MKSAQSHKARRLLAQSIFIIGLSAGLASAQQYVGKVTLPVKTNWGSAVLPPGEYSFEINPSVPSAVTIRREQKRVAMILTTGGITQDQTIKESVLLGIRRGGELRVRTLRLADVQLALFYPQSKDQPTFMANNGPLLVERVSIRMK